MVGDLHGQLLPDLFLHIARIAGFAVRILDVTFKEDFPVSAATQLSSDL